jgi:hypothetical protein
MLTPWQLGLFIDFNARDCQRYLQLVRRYSAFPASIVSDIAQSQLLNEIMPMIYHRFTEKTADQWRQIYKARLAFGLKQGTDVPLVLGSSATRILD